MTHEHYLQLAYNLQAFVPDIVNDPNGSILMFLPQAHTFARAINYGVVGASMHVYIATGIKTLIGDLQVAKPTALIVVPRVLEKVYNAASQKAGHGPQGYVFASAVDTARKYMKQTVRHGKPGPVLAAHRALYEPLVYSQLKEALGGRIKWLVCGGAPLDPELLTFYRGAGIPVYEGYGLTETTAPCAFAPLGTPFRPGSVGVPFPGFSVRLSEEGEIQLQGRSVFHRYHKNAEATKDSFTSDGWFATGDLGRLDVDGFLYITGRKKDLIITAGGKNVSPAPIEEAIQRSSIVSHALVLGDKRPFISALITLDPDTLGGWLESNGLDPNMPIDKACENGAVRAEVQKYVEPRPRHELHPRVVGAFEGVSYACFTHIVDGCPHKVADNVWMLLNELPCTADGTGIILRSHDDALRILGMVFLVKLGAVVISAKIHILEGPV